MKSERVVYVLYDWQQKLFAYGVAGRTGFVTRHINRCREFVRSTDATDFDMETVTEWRDDDDAVTLRPTFLVRQVTITHEML